MNKTTAENFINSLVRNLQALCHSNVEFFDDIEVVGHLYLKVDKSKKFNYIVDEKVSKNDASSTVFVSNSYHSCKQSKSKASECDKDQEKDNQGNLCVAPGPKNVNRQSRSDGEQSKMSMARQDSSEPPYKSQKIFHTDKTDHGESKRAKISYKNLAEKMHLYKNIDSDNSHFEIDLTKIKCEPKDENIPNAEFFLGSSPHTSGNVGGSNAIDTGQANEEYHIDYVQNTSSLPLHQSHLDKPSTSSHSSASTNFLSQDMSQDHDMVDIRFNATSQIKAIMERTDSDFNLLHEQKSSFICPICGSVFGNRQYLKDHVNGKHFDPKCKCECGQTFHWRTQLLRHRLKCHI